MKSILQQYNSISMAPNQGGNNANRLKEEWISCITKHHHIILKIFIKAKRCSVVCY
jgi:hypothetical protein